MCAVSLRLQRQVTCRVRAAVVYTPTEGIGFGSAGKVHEQEGHILSFSSGNTEELNLLLQFDNTTTGSGIKVHSSAREAVISACQRLYDKGLISQRDGGYLTDAGIEALAHAQVLAGLLGEKTA